MADINSIVLEHQAELWNVLKTNVYSRSYDVYIARMRLCSYGFDSQWRNYISRKLLSFAGKSICVVAMALIVYRVH
jgi:hypothetical protein